jgi:hypothetical protein
MVVVALFLQSKKTRHLSFWFFILPPFIFIFSYFLNMNATQAAKIAPRISPWAK